MRVMLTGSAGFIGTAVARALRERGDDVVAVDALIPQAHGVARPDRETHRVDVRDGPAFEALLDGIDVVCHQAAMVGAGTTVADLPLYAAHNDLGTAVVLAAMAAHSIDRLVLASSMVVYGEGLYACATHGPVDPPERRRADLDAGLFNPSCPTCGDRLSWGAVGEDARLRPRSSYAASKVAQEHYARAWADQAPGVVVALRYHNVYGPLMPKDTPYSGVAAVFRSALERGEAPRVFEDGEQMRDFVHVDDVARANLAAIDLVETTEPGASMAYNVCSGRPISIGEVAKTLAAASGSGVEPRTTGEYRVGDVRHIVASPSRAATELGFRATVPPAQGLAKFATEPLRN